MAGFEMRKEEDVEFMGEVGERKQGGGEGGAKRGEEGGGGKKRKGQEGRLGGFC